MLVLLLVFVLGFVVYRMTDRRLVEGGGDFFHGFAIDAEDVLGENSTPI